MTGFFNAQGFLTAMRQVSFKNFRNYLRDNLTLTHLKRK
jgi:hypothetical protein